MCRASEAEWALAGGRSDAHLRAPAAAEQHVRPLHRHPHLPVLRPVAQSALALVRMMTVVMVMVMMMMMILMMMRMHGMKLRLSGAGVRVTAKIKAGSESPGPTKWIPRRAGGMTRASSSGQQPQHTEKCPTNCTVCSVLFVCFAHCESHALRQHPAIRASHSAPSTSSQAASKFALCSVRTNPHSLPASVDIRALSAKHTFAPKPFAARFHT
eukprot:2945842-Rhodomonas_salina.2